MALDQSDIDQIAEVVNGFLATRMEQVYLAIEQLREEFQATINIMDGNDRALIAEFQKVKGMPPAEFLIQAGESWERFIRTEAKHLGLRVIAEKS